MSAAGRLGMLVGAWALAGGSASAEPADPAAGRAVAEQLCAACHLVAPEAQKGPVPVGVPSFAGIAQRWSDPQALADRLIVSPHPEMPPPPLTNRQRADVAAWILSLRP